MPQIPIIGVQSQVAPANVEGGSGGRGVHEMLGAVSGAIGDAGALVLRQQAQAKAVAQKQQLDESQVAITNAVSNEHMTSLRSAVDATNAGKMAGFTDQWSKDFDQRTADGLKAIPQIGQAHYQAQMAELKSRLGVSFYEKEQGARNMALTRDAGDGIESDANTAFIDPSQAQRLIASRRATISSLSIPDAEKAKLYDQAGQTIAYGAGATLATNDPAGFLKRVGVGAADPAAAADALKRDPVLSELKPENLQRLTQHAQGLLAQRQSAADRAAEQAEEIGRKSYNDLVGLVQTGAMPSLSYVADVSKATRGTSYESGAQQLLTMASKSAGFGALSLKGQEKTLAALDAQFSAKGTDPESQTMMTSLRGIHTQQVQAYKDNPWEAATRFAHLPAQPEQTITAPEGGVSLIAARKPFMTGVETVSGGSVSPLQPNEAAQWVQQLSTLSVPQRSDMLARAGDGLSPGQIGALADQIAAKDKPTALMLKLNDRTGAGRAVAEFVGRGAQGLADKTVKADDTAQSGWRAEIAGYIRGTLGNTQAENDAIDAAFYTRAAFELPDTTLPGYASPTASSEAAVAMVIGQPSERGGVKTILPRGMDDSAFNARLRSFTPDVLKAQAPDGNAYVNGQAVPLNLLSNRLPDWGMRYYSPGVYAPVRGNAIVTVDKAGTKPLLLKVQ